MAPGQLGSLAAQEINKKDAPRRHFRCRQMPSLGRQDAKDQAVASWNLVGNLSLQIKSVERAVGGGVHLGAAGINQKIALRRPRRRMLIVRLFEERRRIAAISRNQLDLES